MNLSSWSIKNPIPAVMLFVMLTFAGLISFDYGQRHRKELGFAAACAARLDVAHDLIDISAIGRSLSGSALTDDVELLYCHSAPFVADAGHPATVVGILYDTGQGYPAAEFGRGPDAGIDDDRNINELTNDANAERIANTSTATDRCSERHDGRAAQVGQLTTRDGVIVAVGEYGKASLHQGLGSFEQLDDIRHERLVVADHLQFDPVGLERFACQLCREDRIFCGIAARDRKSVV